MGQIAQSLKQTGYTCFTHIERDLDTSEMFGTYTIESSFNIAYNKAKNDIKYLTELVLILNYKYWYWAEHTEKTKDKDSKEHDKLYFIH